MSSLYNSVTRLPQKCVWITELKLILTFALIYKVILSGSLQFAVNVALPLEWWQPTLKSYWLFYKWMMLVHSAKRKPQCRQHLNNEDSLMQGVNANSTCWDHILIQGAKWARVAVCNVLLAEYVGIHVQNVLLPPVGVSRCLHEKYQCSTLVSLCSYPVLKRVLFIPL